MAAGIMTMIYGEEISSTKTITGKLRPWGKVATGQAEETAYILILRKREKRQLWLAPAKEERAKAAEGCSPRRVV